jgi:hypothetical protein
MTKPIVRQKHSRILSDSSAAMVPEPKRRGKIFKFKCVTRQNDRLSRLNRL